ncbi:acyl CoA:acetate/3-ketoacid CoA transferase alpha subunit [Nocardioides zeae]|uniref:Acyl CoA:acetate/3-ketoacid CoA transferase alpha subunit n=1 Tax=Nocardioides zeae TaxID=1457234 RepID=A0ACC6IHT6_9ACTN|nr:CoA-transferase [Nocardioides zeae]MDR6176200.1 acyl CoA:acetate/3-ketoacid CoA transferase alpha subunit [Nocardioides zeae]MDR6210346.1 acyl CoA:acetate/3-ketoacid CoA transferase alpha subunit [Nocardioides zeae]
MRATPGSLAVFHASGPDDLVSTFVGADDHVHLAATLSRPNALGNALARQFRGRRSLTVSTTAVHSSAHALTIAGAVRKVVTGFLGDTYPTPRPNPLYRALADGEPFEVEMWSLLTYTQRLMAAATGQPWATTGSRIAESDLSAARTEHVARVTHPDGTEVTLLSPLRPDWTLVHGACADRRGNVVLAAPVGEGAWAAYAARHGVLASVERVVDEHDAVLPPDHVMVPGHLVRGICEAPYGAHPQSLRSAGIGGVEGYLDDYHHLTEIVEACRTEEGRQAWFDRWVQVEGHEQYLEQLRVDGAPARIAPSAPPAAAATVGPGVVEPGPPSSASTQEQLTVLAARAVVALVEERGYDTLLAGIGTSHVAAWLARRMLQERGRRVAVAAELGFLDMDPVDGDVFLFSQRHASRSAMLGGVAEVLGGAVAANPRCLGVLSAAEIDRTGTINTSQLPDGRWITGSGGANDIASTTDCLVVAPASRRRYVDRVAHRTSPGDRVRDVVSQFGWFRRDDAGQDFTLTTWLAPPDAPPDLDPRGALRGLTTWPGDGARATAEKPVTSSELRILRSLDPEGHYR